MSDTAVSFDEIDHYFSEMSFELGILKEYISELEEKIDSPERVFFARIPLDSNGMALMRPEETLRWKEHLQKQLPNDRVVVTPFEVTSVQTADPDTIEVLRDNFYI